MSELARRIEAAMRAKGHKQNRAAESLSVSQSLLSLLKNDQTPLVEERWPAFATYMGVGEDEVRRLVEEAADERQAQSVPSLDLESEVLQLKAAVAQIGADQTKQRGMIEMIGMVLGVDPEPPKPPTPRRRAPSRRVK